MKIRRRVGVVLVSVGAVVLIGMPSDAGRAKATASTCAATSVGTDATPVVMVCSPTAGTPTAQSSPIAADGMSITLELSSDQAGPVTMTVRLHDELGQPITDASVVVAAEHLDMNMGMFPHDAIGDGSGTYIADWVGMGMGGHWRIEVTVTRPGAEPITADFTVTMGGLQ